MKHFIITGLVLSALFGSQVSYAQSRQSFDDDIYYNSKSQPKATKTITSPTNSTKPAEPAPTYNSSDYSTVNNNENSADYQNSTAFQTNTGTYFKTYETEGYEEEGYQEYGDDYSYATQINRMYYPWYGQPYWSACYTPYWYNPWYAPGFSFGIGFGWGYSSMYFGFGYPYYPYYGYPYYGYGYGGYGGYCGYGGYYPGGGYCGGGYGYNAYPVSYGPRYSTNTIRNDYAHGSRPSRGSSTGEKAPVPTIPANTNMSSLSSGVRYDRGTTPSQNQSSGAPASTVVRSEANSAPVPVFNDSRNAPTYQSNQPANNNNVSNSNGRPGAAQSAPNSSYSNGVRNEASSPQQVQPQQSRPQRGGFFGGRNSNPSVGTVESTPRSQPSYSQPRMERSSAPRTSSPSGNSFGGGRSGSFGGGSGGGGMRGGGGRR